MNRFPDNARVCFVGDSITNNNTYIAHIVSFYRKNFPDSHIEFYNCGISGGSISTCISAYDEYTAIYDPTHIVLMIGVNDACTWLFDRDKSSKRFEDFEAAFERYKSNVASFYNFLKERNIELTICTPMPYDEYQKSPEVAYPGGYALIMGYAEFIRGFSRENNLPLCDYHTFATRAMQDEVIFNSDRVHPNNRGHYIMAKCFLASQGLELGEEQPIPDELKEWFEKTSLLQNCPTVENFIVSDAFTKPVEERIEAINNYLENDHSSVWYTHCAKIYVEHKPRQEEYIAFVKDFMKK